MNLYHSLVESLPKPLFPARHVLGKPQSTWRFMLLTKQIYLCFYPTHKPLKGPTVVISAAI